MSHALGTYLNSQGCIYGLRFAWTHALELIFFSAWPKLHQGKFSLEQVRCCQGLNDLFLFSSHRNWCKFTEGCNQTLQKSLATQKSTKNTSLPCCHISCHNLIHVMKPSPLSSWMLQLTNYAWSYQPDLPHLSAGIPMFIHASATLWSVTIWNFLPSLPYHLE
jgi:hypothetical protein